MKTGGTVHRPLKYPPYLFTHLEAILRRCRRSHQVFLFLDFDGTLAPIAPHPDRAVLSRGNRSLLKSISTLPRVRLAVISGRSLSDLEGKTRLPGVLQAGNHGLEIRFHSREKPWVHPGARRFRKRIDHLASELNRALTRYPGGYLEHKGFTLSLHYRMLKPTAAAEFLRTARAVLAPHLTRQSLHVHRGKKVIEVYPPIRWDKGKAVLYIKNRWGRVKKNGRRPPARYFSIYIGDDQTDEDAFLALGGRDRGSGPVRSPGSSIGIRVGKTMKTRADYYVRDAGEVAVFLKMIEKSVT